MHLPRNNQFACLLGLGVVVFAATCARGDDVIPQPAAAKRYDKLSAHSPFAPPTGPVETKPAPTPPPAPPWTENLTVTSLMQINNVYTATIMEKDSSDHYMIRSDVEDPEHHLEVATVKWADKPDEIKVTLRKGTQFGDVHFDPSASPDGGGSTPVSPPMPVQPMPPRPNMVTQPGIIRPPPGGMPGPPNRFPGNQPGNNLLRNRPIIRANPGAPGAPMRPIITPPNAVRAAPARPANGDDDEDND